MRKASWTFSIGTIWLKSTWSKVTFSIHYLSTTHTIFRLTAHLQNVRVLDLIAYFLIAKVSYSQIFLKKFFQLKCWIKKIATIFSGFSDWTVSLLSLKINHFVHSSLLFKWRKWAGVSKNFCFPLLPSKMPSENNSSGK